MLITALLDGIGWFLIHVLHHANNAWIYNIVMLVGIPFTFWILYNISKPLYKVKPWIMAGLLLFVVSFVIESSRLGFLYRYNRMTLVLMSVIFIVACGVYYYLLLRQEGYVLLSRYPPFWIVTGIFIFYFGGVALYVYLTNLQRVHLERGIAIHNYVMAVLNFILYGSWAYAFRCRRLQTI